MSSVIQIDRLIQINWIFHISTKIMRHLFRKWTHLIYIYIYKTHHQKHNKMVKTHLGKNNKSPSHIRNNDKIQNSHLYYKRLIWSFFIKCHLGDDDVWISLLLSASEQEERQPSGLTDTILRHIWAKSLTVCEHSYSATLPSAHLD